MRTLILGLGILFSLPVMAEDFDEVGGIADETYESDGYLVEVGPGARAKFERLVGAPEWEDKSPDHKIRCRQGTGYNCCYQYQPFDEWKCMTPIKK
ncbi:hypothetical protein K2X33_02260 [bacterium]|nr:hypothetical protein [bacterium]